MTISNLNARIDGIFLGNITEKWPGRPPSAIAKTAVVGCQDINEFGFKGGCGNRHLMVNINPKCLKVIQIPYLNSIYIRIIFVYEKV